MFLTDFLTVPSVLVVSGLRLWFAESCLHYLNLYTHSIDAISNGMMITEQCTVLVVGFCKNGMFCVFKGSNNEKTCRLLQIYKHQTLTFSVTLYTAEILHWMLFLVRISIYLWDIEYNHACVIQLWLYGLVNLISCDLWQAVYNKQFIFQYTFHNATLSFPYTPIKI